MTAGQEELNRPRQIKQCSLFVLHVVPYVPPSIIFLTRGVCGSPLPCSRKKTKGNGQAVGPLSVSQSKAGGMRESQQEVEAKRREESWWQRDPAPTSPATLSPLQRGRGNIPLSPSHGVRQDFPRNGETGLKALWNTSILQAGEGERSDKICCHSWACSITPVSTWQKVLRKNHIYTNCSTLLFLGLFA